MGKFSDKILDMFKNQDLNKSSCLKRGIYVFISILTIAIVTIVAVVHTMKQSSGNDLTKFLNLISKEYESFTPNITKAQGTDFKEYILEVARIEGGELYNDNNFNLEGFLSDKLVTNEEFRLNFYDLAVLLNYYWNDNLLTVERVDTSCDGVKVEWAALISVDLKSIINEQSENASTKVFVTFSSKVNLLKTWNENAVESFNLQVNRLTGEDNEFATKEICRLLNISNKTLCEYAIYPFVFAKTQATMWGKNLSFCEDCTFEFN